MKTKEKQAGSASVESARAITQRDRPNFNEFDWHAIAKEQLSKEVAETTAERDELKQTLALYILNNGIIEQQRDELLAACKEMNVRIRAAIKKATEAQP